MSNLSPAALASVGFAVAFSPAIIFVKFASALGDDKARLTYTGTEGLVNIIWILLAALGVAVALLYIARRANSLKAENEHLQKEREELYRLSLNDGSVFRGDQRLALAPLQFKLLGLLISRRGQLCTTDEILQHLYENTEDRAALNQLISRLRSELNIHEYVARNENNLGYSFNQWVPPQ
jgi:hypothetical protein